MGVYDQLTAPGPLDWLTASFTSTQFLQIMVKDEVDGKVTDCAVFTRCFRLVAVDTPTCCCMSLQVSSDRPRPMNEMAEEKMKKPLETNHLLPTFLKSPFCDRHQSTQNQKWESFCRRNPSNFSILVSHAGTVHGKEAGCALFSDFIRPGFHLGGSVQ